MRLARYAVAVAGFLLFAALLLGVAMRAPGPPFTAELRPVRLPARIIFYGDSRPRVFVETGWRADPGEAVRREVIRAIAAERPALIVHSGDLVSWGDSPGAWSIFDRDHAAFRDADIPFYPALGNHEYYGWNTIGLWNYFQRFPLLQERRWYELRVGPLAILVVDTNAGALDPWSVEDQQRWYEERLQATATDGSVRCVVVVGHHSPFTNAISHGPDDSTQQRFVEPGRRFPKVKLFVTGHVHSYERFEIDGRTFVVSGGGGAPRFSLRTGADARYRDSFAGPQYRPFHYCVATLEEHRLTIDVMMLDDEAMTWSRGDAFTIDF